jgi:predicted acetyltransferase
VQENAGPVHYTGTAMDAAFDYGPPANEAETQTLGEILVHGLAPTPPTDAAWYPSWLERVRDLGDARVVRRGGRVAGGLVNFSLGQWFGGRSVRTGGIASVAVAPEHRSRGAATHLMRELVRELRSRGVALSTLTPASQVLYRKAGYELAGVQVTYRLPLHAFDVRRGDMDVRPATEADHPRLHEIYTARARGCAGYFDRSPGYWRHRVLSTPRQATFCYVVERGGVVQGYVVFTHQAEPLVRYDVYVKDLCAVSHEAYANLLTFLSAHRSMAPHVFFTGGLVEPVLYLLGEQYDRAITRRVDWMVRVVDVPGALAARGYPRGIAAELHLDVADDLVPENNGRFVLAVRDGEGAVRRGGDGALRTDVRGLAAMYTGYYTTADAVLAGRAVADEASRDVAQALFAGPAPCMPDEF